MSDYQDIPYGDNLENIKKCAANAELDYRVIHIRGVIRVYFEDPIDLYWLGCNVVALSAGIFEIAITTHAARHIKLKK